jgi:transposase
MTNQKRRTYSKDFKISTVKLIIDGQRPLKAVARDLNIDPASIRLWRKQYLEDRENAFPGKGHQKPDDEELYRLKKELADIKEENAILKKALAIFSKQPK